VWLMLGLFALIAAPTLGAIATAILALPLRWLIL